MAAGVSINLQNHFDQVTVDSGGHRSVVKCRRLDDLPQLSRRGGTVLDDVPGWFIDGCQVYARQNLQARHDRHLIAAAYAREGYSVQPIEREATTLERQRCSTQKAQTDAANEREAGRVADASPPSDDQSPEASAAARKKDQICNRFNIVPAELTTQHVLDIGNAFPALRNRLLYDNTTALGLFTHGRLKQLGDAYVLERVRIAKLHLQLHWIKQLTTEACAADLLTSKDWFSANDAWVKLSHRLVMEDSCAKRYPSRRHSASAVLSALCRQFCASLASARKQSRSELVGKSFVFTASPTRCTNSPLPRC